MISIKKPVLTIAVVIGLSVFAKIGTATAQDQTARPDTTDNDAKSSLSLAIQPMFMLNNAGKIDLEWQPVATKLAYVFTVEVYSGRIKDVKAVFDNPSDVPWDRINGAGIGIAQKYKFKNERSSPYLAYGLTYRYQEINIETKGFFTYEQDGLTYYDYGPLEKNLAVSSGLATAVFGYQKISDDFLYDFYFGFGYKAQFNNTEFEGLRRFDSSIVNYAYKGFGMVAGFKIGYQFR